MTRLLPAALAAAVVLAVAGCGSDDDDGGSTTSGASTPPPTQTQTQQAGGSSTDLSQKPAIERPSGEPPKKLVSEDIVRGKGQQAKTGDDVEVQYVGVAYSTGQEFDSSWDRNEPFQFTLGAGMVIPGWDRGIPGMKIGGRRKLTIPPDLAYGAEGSPPAIGPNETLIFVVDLKRIRQR